MDQDACVPQPNPASQREVPFGAENGLEALILCTAYLYSVSEGFGLKVKQRYDTTQIDMLLLDGYDLREKTRNTEVVAPLALHDMLVAIYVALRGSHT